VTEAKATHRNAADGQGGPDVRQIPFGAPVLGAEERQAVLAVLDGPILTHGPKCAEFESAFAEFVGGGHALAVSSCAGALHLAYFYLGIGPGDEVIVPAQTHVATAHAVEICGARPVFVDCEPDTGNIDVEAIERAITERTRAISVVHFLGAPVRMGHVMKIALARGLFVVEDCALAVGTKVGGVHAGLVGDVGCFSFYPVKHMTTGEGGMFVTRSSEIAAKVARQRAFGVDRHMAARTMPGVYDVDILGLNYRMSELQAALGVEQLKRMPAFLAARQRNFHTLSAALRGIAGVKILQACDGPDQSSYYCLSAVLEDSLARERTEIVRRLKQQGVGTSVYYPHPVPLLTYYRRKYGAGAHDFPHASRISDNSIALPVGPHLNESDMSHIARVVTSVIEDL
jgi:perosamine synthetase